MKRYVEWLRAQWREFIGLDAAWNEIHRLDTQIALLWLKYEAHEGRDAKVAAAMLDQAKIIDRLRADLEGLRRRPTDPLQHETRIVTLEQRTDPLQEVVHGRLIGHDVLIAGLQVETENLRRIVTARKAEEPAAPKIARTWREVQNFMGDNDAPAS